MVYLGAPHHSGTRRHSVRGAHGRPIERAQETENRASQGRMPRVRVSRPRDGQAHYSAHPLELPSPGLRWRSRLRRNRRRRRRDGRVIAPLTLTRTLFKGTSTMTNPNPNLSEIRALAREMQASAPTLTTGKALSPYLRGEAEKLARLAGLS